LVDVVVNELLSHSDPPALDAIELLNTTNNTVDISGWYVSDARENYRKYRIPAGTLLGPGQYLVLDESDFNASGGEATGDFALNSAHGDDVWLVQADLGGRLLRFADHVEFGATETGVSMGRWPNGTGSMLPMEHLTLGQANSSPKAGDVIISELHYHPVDSDGYGPLLPRDFEFVELYNRTSNPVDLSGWRLAGGVDLTLKGGTTIGPRQALLAVPFDPGDQGQTNLFRLAYGLGPDTQLAGPYSGTLDNGGETIRLQRPDESPPEELDFTPYVLVDRVRYDDQAPWPASADGQGDSLTRTSSVAPGDLPTSWTAARPSAGHADLFVRRVGDSNEDGRFDQLDIVLTLRGGKYLTGQPATWRDGDWTGDGRFDQNDIVAALREGTYLQGPYAGLPWLASGIDGRAGLSPKDPGPAQPMHQALGGPDADYVSAIDLIMEQR
jgi:hypothetical protein